jgi:hypothetical protein
MVPPSHSPGMWPQRQPDCPALSGRGKEHGYEFKRPNLGLKYLSTTMFWFIDLTIELGIEPSKLGLKPTEASIGM